MSFAYLPLYTGDYLRDTAELSPREHGAYLLMLMWCWQRAKPMPNDMLRICRIACSRDAQDDAAVAYVLDEFFELGDDGCYHNRRLEAELQRSAAYVDRAKAGASARWGKDTNAKRMLNACLSDAKAMPPSPSPSPSLNQPQGQPQIQDPGGAPPAPPSDPSTGLRSGKPARKRAVKPVAPSSDVWAAYSRAYLERYGVDPVRNAKVNSQMSALVGRLGADEAPGVARAYVANRNSLYAASKHCTDLLLRDAEKLRTEWATGQVITQTQALQGDKTQATINVFGPMLEEARAREAMNGNRSID